MCEADISEMQMDLSQLLTEQRNSASSEIDRVPTEQMLQIINAEDQKVAVAVATAIPQLAAAVDLVAGRVQKGGRLFYIGAGTSGRLGVLDAAECSPTFSVPAEMVQGIIAGGETALSKATEATEDDPAMGRNDLLARGFGKADTLVGIAASGRTPYVLGAIAEAKAMGAATIGISCTPGAELSQRADIGIELLVGPEVLTGSTRMKAGTATKLALNMLTTGMMIRLGYTYGNLMVNVQPKNEKLVDRAQRIIADGAQVERTKAAELLAASAGNVKTAIVMGCLGISREAAEGKLREAAGFVVKALEK